MKARSFAEKAVRCVRRSFAVLFACLIAVVLVVCPGFASHALAASNNQVNPQLLPDSSFLYDTSIADLAEADSYYDNQTVRVTGEVVGDRLAAFGDAGHCWITLASLAEGVDATVQVHLTTEQASRIDTYGAYGKRGTILNVQGTFHLVCAEHDGESDIHAESVTVSAVGEVAENELDPMLFAPGAAVVSIGLLMMVALWRLQERGR